MSLLSWVVLAYICLFGVPLGVATLAPDTDLGRDCRNFFSRFGTALALVFLGFAFADLLIHLGTL